MQISPPPIHPQNPKNSPPKDMANKVAETGSNENIRAVSVGFSIFCAQIMMNIANAEAMTPFIIREEISVLFHITVVSLIAIDDNPANNDTLKH